MYNVYIMCMYIYIHKYIIYMYILISMSILSIDCITNGLIINGFHWSYFKAYFFRGPSCMLIFPGKVQVFQCRKHLTCGFIDQLNRQKTLLFRDQFVQVPPKQFLGQKFVKKSEKKHRTPCHVQLRKVLFLMKK